MDLDQISIDYFTRHAHLCRVLNIENEYRPLNTPWNADNFNWYLKDKDCVNYIARHKREILGYVISWPSLPHCVQIIRVFVRPEFRRMGIGTRMVEVLQDMLDWDGLYRISMFVPEVPPYCWELLPFLEANGFRNLAHIPNQDCQVIYLYQFNLRRPYRGPNPVLADAS